AALPRDLRYGLDAQAVLTQQLRLSVECAAIGDVVLHLENVDPRGHHQLQRCSIGYCDADEARHQVLLLDRPECDVLLAQRVQLPKAHARHRMVRRTLHNIRAEALEPARLRARWSLDPHEPLEKVAWIDDLRLAVTLAKVGQSRLVDQ